MDAVCLFTCTVMISTPTAPSVATWKNGGSKFFISFLWLSVMLGLYRVFVGCDIGLLSYYFFSPAGKDEGAMIVMEAAWSVFSLFVQFQVVTHKTRSFKNHGSRYIKSP